jgi:hypothetical protein
MALALLHLTTTELVILVLIGAGLICLPLGVVLLALRIFNEVETNRRSDVVDQALTRDEDISPLPPADEPAGKPRV